MHRQASRGTSGRAASVVLLGSFLVAVLVLLVVFLLNSHANGRRADSQHIAAAQATVAVLRTVVAGQQDQRVARETEVVQLQQRIRQLQGTISVAMRTPVNQANGPRSYLASFQVGKYTYIMYIAWTESSGFIHDGRLFTTDNYARKASKSLQLAGVNNRGSYGFTISSQGVTTTFTGKANSDRSFTVNGMPWNVFSGFTGGTFTQTLHPATRQDYNSAVANLGNPPQ